MSKKEKENWEEEFDEKFPLLKNRKSTIEVSYFCSEEVKAFIKRIQND